MSTHVIKFTHNNGKKLAKPELWCGRQSQYSAFYFVDAQHVALAVGGSIQPCKNCIKSIIKELKKEL